MSCDSIYCLTSSLFSDHNQNIGELIIKLGHEYLSDFNKAQLVQYMIYTLLFVLSLTTRKIVIVDDVMTTVLNNNQRIVIMFDL